MCYSEYLTVPHVISRTRRAYVLLQRFRRAARNSKQDATEFYVFLQHLRRDARNSKQDLLLRVL